MMQSPWGSEQQAYAIGPRGPLVAVAAQGPMSPTGSRGSLGKFIERSTSAPPPSGHHAAKHDIPYDDSLVGNYNFEVGCGLVDV